MEEGVCAKRYSFPSLAVEIIAMMRVMESLSEINALLDFYRAAGVDETIGDLPVNRFEVSTKARHPKAASEMKAPPQATARSVPPPKAALPPSAPLKSLEEAASAACKLAHGAGNIECLRKAVAGYDGCSLRKMAMNTVFAEGDPSARLMIIDRPPSVDEDRSGTPFAGAAGELLNRMLAAIDLKREDCYLASLLPWRPPGGRAPTQEELALCLPFIERHITLARPQYLLVCGEAAGFLLKRDTGINKLRGTWTDYPAGETNIPLLPIFHPTFLLEYPAAKRHAWRDLLQLRAALERE
ncbi:MAG: uracil-DNA glycosylase [Alphaproteobacteria bacterium]|nr:MAG: uracil-DNA glycosylase [Alphaproteobacteria bacterium]